MASPLAVQTLFSAPKFFLFGNALKFLIKLKQIDIYILNLFRVNAKFDGGGPSAFSSTSSTQGLAGRQQQQQLTAAQVASAAGGQIPQPITTSAAMPNHPLNPLQSQHQQPAITLEEGRAIRQELQSIQQSLTSGPELSRPIPFISSFVSKRIL